MGTVIFLVLAVGAPDGDCHYFYMPSPSYDTPEFRLELYAAHPGEVCFLYPWRPLIEKYQSSPKPPLEHVPKLRRGKHPWVDPKWHSYTPWGTLTDLRIPSPIRDG